MISKIDKNAVRRKRHLRVRKNISGTPERPRLNVYRSNKNIYAQLIDDVNHKTLASASTQDKEFKGELGSNKEAARDVGTIIAARANAAGVGTVLFDRDGDLYHGRVAGLGDAARDTGLTF